MRRTTSSRDDPLTVLEAEVAARGVVTVDRQQLRLLDWQASNTYGQRGENEQPFGRKISDGGEPEIGVEAVRYRARAAGSTAGGPTCTASSGR